MQQLPQPRLPPPVTGQKSTDFHGLEGFCCRKSVLIRAIRGRFDYTGEERFTPIVVSDLQVAGLLDGGN
jgi:hypothetical protein